MFIILEALLEESGAKKQKDLSYDDQISPVQLSDVQLRTTILGVFVRAFDRDPTNASASENTLSKSVFFVQERVVSTTDLTWACNVYGRNWTRPSHPQATTRGVIGGW